MWQQFIGFFLFWTITVATAGAAEIPITINTLAEAGTNKQLASAYLVRLLNERSHGRLLAQLSPTGTFSQAIQQLNRDQVQVVMPDIESLTQEDSRLRAFSFPYLFRDRQQMHTTIDQEVGLEFLPNKFRQKYKVLSLWETETNHIVSVHNHGDSLALDAKLPTEMLGDRLDLFLTGLVPCRPERKNTGWRVTTLTEVLADSSQHKSRKLILTGHNVAGYILLARNDFWDRLPGDLQVIVKDAIKDATTYARELTLQAERAALEKLSAMDDLEIINVSADRKKIWKKILATIQTDTCSSGQVALIEHLSTYATKH